jgi:hypothetical protein
MTMRRSFRSTARLLACAAMLGAAVPAWADLSRDDAAAVAQREARGRVLSVERAGPAWRVKVLTPGGEVRVLLVDAATGRVQ